MMRALALLIIVLGVIGVGGRAMGQAAAPPDAGSYGDGGEVQPKGDGGGPAGDYGVPNDGRGGGADQSGKQVQLMDAGQSPGSSSFLNTGSILGIFFALIAIGSVLAMLIAPPIVSYHLATQKGYAPALWVVLGLIPGLGFYTLLYLVGTRDRLLEAKIDDALRRLERGQPDQPSSL